MNVQDAALLNDSSYSSSRWKLSAIVCESNLQFGQPVALSRTASTELDGYQLATFDDALGRFPRLISDRLDRALLNLAKLAPNLGQNVSLSSTSGDAVLFAKDNREATFVLKALLDEGVVEEIAPAGLGEYGEIVVSPAGWNRVAELESGRHRSPRNPVFVAMWFGKEGQAETPKFMTVLFDEHIRPAIARAGFVVGDRVDVVPHNDFIMDKVIGMIRAAPFVVADFTGNRNGVYFEAGFARGLNIPVIHTCRDTYFDDAHFDIKQINTIQWEHPAELAEKLYHRIVGSIGEGPYQPKQT